ncbi:hypothetical protein KPL33_12195 [Clostridium algidicarnis]|uniref:hypothetical protein n=1 Tax=Clostridium algidicarnis TaxID=37659 RepID=UPI001C0E4546|nr:hypothetical protein [Clostridium algidicarnis]MBU3207729.1 hypothetical protein [Clostridium algidicarnis]
MEEKLITLGMSLAEVVSRNSISFVGNKMKLAKEKKDLDSQSLAYSEIINNLLQDKEELTMIAREYKQAYEQITISDEDIVYLHNTLSGALEILNAFSPQKEDSKEAMETMIKLLNKDTLKTMQLLGFNYKEAIGQPLTEVCSETIKNKLGIKNIKNTNKNQSKK